MIAFTEQTMDDRGNFVSARQSSGQSEISDILLFLLLSS